MSTGALEYIYIYIYSYNRWYIFVRMNACHKREIESQTEWDDWNASWKYVALYIRCSVTNWTSKAHDVKLTRETALGHKQQYML